MFQYSIIQTLTLMGRHTQIILTIALLAITQFQGTAQQPVSPPSGLPQERWELTYDDYRAPCDTLYIFTPHTDYPVIPPSETLGNLKKEVVMVRDGKDVYIRGIFSEYAGSWIKGTVNGDRLVIPNNQILDASGPTYFHWGATNYINLNGGENIVIRAVIFTPEDDTISFGISEDGKIIRSKSLANGGDMEVHAPSFWFDNDERGDWTFEFNLQEEFVYNNGDGYKNIYNDGCGFPNIPYAINMVFRKIED